jgi:hypothetical protein
MFIPAFCKRNAVVNPAIPPPITTTFGLVAKENAGILEKMTAMQKIILKDR